MISVLKGNKGIISFHCGIKDVMDVISGKTPSNNTEKVKEIRDLVWENKLDEAKELKKSLMAVTYNACFNRRRTKNNLYSYSGYIYLDFDQVPTSLYISQLKELPYIRAIWKSVSGLGVSALIKTGEITDEVMFDSTVRDIHEYIEAEGLGLDKGCKDSTRMTYLSYDEDLIIKTALPFPVSRNELPITPRINKTPIYESSSFNFYEENSMEDSLKIAYNSARKKHGDYRVGVRNSFLMSYAGTCLALGVPEADAVPFAMSFATHDETEKVSDAYRRYYGSFGQYARPKSEIVTEL